MGSNQKPREFSGTHTHTEQTTTSQQSTAAGQSNSEAQEQLGLSIGQQGNNSGTVAMNVAVEDLRGCLANTAALAELGITDTEAAHFEHLAALGAEYAANGNVHLVSNVDQLPIDIAEHLNESLAVYSPQFDVIYLRSNERSPHALNTLFHEVAHAARKDSPESILLESLHIQLSVGGGDAFEDPSDITTGLDYYLLLAFEELNAEVDGNIIGEIASNAAEDGERAGGRAGRVERWRGRETHGASSNTAMSDWRQLLLMSEDWLNGDAYRTAGEEFLSKQGGRPSASDFVSH